MKRRCFWARVRVGFAPSWAAVAAFPLLDKSNQSDAEPGEGELSGGNVQKLPSALRVWPLASAELHPTVHRRPGPASRRTTSLFQELRYAPQSPPSD